MTLLEIGEFTFVPSHIVAWAVKDRVLPATAALTGVVVTLVWTTGGETPFECSGDHSAQIKQALR